MLGTISVAALAKAEIDQWELEVAIGVSKGTGADTRSGMGILARINRDRITELLLALAAEQTRLVLNQSPTTADEISAVEVQQDRLLEYRRHLP